MLKLIINLKQKILGSEFNKNVAILASGTALAQAIPVLISPVLTRLYTPSDFGTLALFVSITSILSVISCGRYELAIMLPEKEEDAINVSAVAFIFNICISFLFFLFILFFGNWFLRIMKAETLKGWIYLAPMTVFFMGFFNILNYTNNRFKLYKDIAKANVYKSLTGAGVQIILGFFKCQFVGLILGQIVSQITANTKLFLNIKNWLIKINRVKIKEMTKKYLNFPKYNLWHALFNVVFTNIPVYVLLYFFSSEILGFYSLATRIVFLPTSILSTSVSNVLYQKVMSLYNSKKLYLDFIYKFLKYQILFGVFLSFGFFIFSKFIVCIFGNNWIEVGNYITAIIPWNFMVFVVSPISFVINMMGQQLKGFIVEIFYSLTKFLSLILGVYFFKQPVFAVKFFSFSCSFFLLFQGLWFLKLFRAGEKEYAKI